MDSGPLLDLTGMIHLLAYNFLKSVNLCQPTVAIHTETSHLVSSANEMTDIYMKCNAGLKVVTITQSYP